MPRPKKATVDYFPHYVNHGKTLFIIEQRFGNDGYAFWFKLLELLGSNDHHFLDCRDTDVWEFLLAKTRLDGIMATEILDKLADLDAIDRELWAHKIIWSENFVANLSFAYKRREVTVYTKADIVSFCIHKPHSAEVSADIYPAIEEKGIEEKGRETREREIPPALASGEELTKKLIDDWKKTFKTPPDSTLVKQARPYVKQAVIEGKPPDAIRFALEKLRLGKPLSYFGSYLAEYTEKDESSKADFKLKDKAIQCDEECGRYECGTQKGDVLFDYCIHCKRHQNRDSRAHVP